LGIDIVIGIGDLGSKLGSDIARRFNTRYMKIGEDIINGILSPSVSELRYQIYRIHKDIIQKIDGTNILFIGDLSEKITIAALPLLTFLLKDNKDICAIVAMPYSFENRLYEAKQALDNINKNTNCNIVIDKDALLQANPDLNIEDCNIIIDNTIKNISNAIFAKILESKENMVSASVDEDIEIAFRDAMRMLYVRHDPDEVTEALVCIYGKNTSIGKVNVIAKYMNDTFSNAKICVTMHENGNGIVLLTRSNPKFDMYDPLSKIDYNIDPNVENIMKIDLSLDQMEL
jgi:hypothetical protein